MPDIWKSRQLMKVSGGSVHATFIHVCGWNAFRTRWYSVWLNVSVGLPTLLKSLQELPVFQSHRPTTFPDGHVKSSGRVQLALISLPIVEAASDVAQA